MDAADLVIDRQLVGIGCAEDTPYGQACDGLGPINVLPPKTEEPTLVSLSWDNVGLGCGGWTRESVMIEASLETFSLVRREEWRTNTGSENTTTKSWDFSKPHYVSEWRTTRNEFCANRKRGPFVGIPRMELPDNFTSGRWQSADFGSCAVRIGTDPTVPPGGAKSIATLRTVMSDADALFVDIMEAPQARPGAKLQICFAKWNNQSLEYCETTEQPQCTSVGMDGQLISGTLPVERATDKARFRFQLPPDKRAVTVTYIAANGRSIGSSTFRGGDTTSLSEVFPIGPKIATCTFANDQLVLTPTRSMDHALLDPEGLD